MPRKKKEALDDTIKEKMEYIGLDFEDIPKNLVQTHNLNFKVLKGYDEKQYKQYRFINIKDIDILLTPTNRLNELKEKYEQARPLYMYLDSKDEEMLERHTTFLSMLKKVQIAGIEKVEKEQEMLAKALPFKVKYNGNYLWQIYYSESTGKYFMLVPTQDSDYSTFFYLLKKKIENKKDEKIFVPVSYVDYSGAILKKAELRDIENYLWLFTKDYPSIYEVYDKKGNISLQIIGETQIYGKVKSLYKMSFDTTKEASKFYKLLRALFILQTELPHYYDFKTNIEEKGALSIYLNNAKIQYESLPEFVLEQYIKSVGLKEQTRDEIDNLSRKLAILKQETAELETEYLAKEKQISTFLECKKTFFGKVKYYFKFGKKSNKNKKKEEQDFIEENQEQNIEKKTTKSKFKLEDRNYTLDELIVSFKELEITENNKKDTVMDINAMKLKNKNLKKKIENATSYINEIDEHKKSIFEFWKYSNKDEVAALEEGEEEELNINKIEKTFDFNEDFEKFSQNIDKEQRKKFTDSELDSSFIATTELLNLINRTYKKKAEPQEFSDMVKKLKDQKAELEDDDEFDVLGDFSSDNTKERNLGNKTHREPPRDKYQILEVKKGMKGLELKKILVNVVKDIKKALKKNELEEDIYVYKVLPYELDFNELQTFSLNEEDELEQCLKLDRLKRKIYMYRIKLHKGTNFIAFSNIIYYNNKNMTLPVGMNVSNKILVDLSSLDIKEVNSRSINKVYLENSKNDFSKLLMKTLEVHEME